MRSYQDLIEEASTVDVSGWDFSWLEGRATEERPAWGYSRLLADRLARAGSAVDLDTGGGEVIAEVPQLPERMVVTEAWPPNADHARRLLGPRGVEVMPVDASQPLPLPDASFELVTSRHPVTPRWAEIARILVDGGTCFAQHVGPASAFELIEYFRGPQPEGRMSRHPDAEGEAARAAGLGIVDLRTTRCAMRFYDIGAVVYILRKCVWWVPDFTVDRYQDALQRLDQHLRTHGHFTAHSTRSLIEARLKRLEDRDWLRRSATGKSTIAP
jgi:hypothetical protein